MILRDFKIAIVLLLLPLFVSCVTTATYTQTNSKVYEDGIVIEENYTETKQAKDGSSKEKSSKVVTYHDLSNAGYIITNTEENASKGTLTTTSHSFVASRTIENKSDNSTIVFSLVETTIVDNAKAVSVSSDIEREINYSSQVIGTRTLKVDGNGKVVSNSSGSSASSYTQETGTFTAEDDELFEEVLSLTLAGIVDPPDREILEEAGKSYRIEEEIKTISVDSSPNGQYIAYSFLGKPFVILGSSAWNLIKCAGYSFYNFTGGYALMTGNLPEGMSPWKMPSVKTAQKKFEEAKETNSIKNYPEYHIPFTDNTISEHVIEQNSQTYFITKENVEVTRDTTQTIKNEVSVSRSASADAAYTSGIVGVLGTVLTIPVSVVTWVGGAAFGIAGTMSR